MEPKEVRAWCAGIIDGEGYVTRRKHTRGCKTQPFVRVENTNKEILCKLAEYYGGKISLAIRKDRPSHKPCWYWQLCNRKCIHFLSEIEPYLVGKKEKVNKVIIG